MVTLETSRAGADHVSVTLIEVWDVEKSTLVETFLMQSASTLDAALEIPQTVIGLDAEPDPAAAIAALVRSRQSSAHPEKYVKRTQSSASSTPQDDLLFVPSPTVRAIIVGPEFGGYQSSHRAEFSDLTNEPNTHSRSLGRGFMITGSEDRRVRLWDLGRLERTAVLSGLESEHEKPSYRFAIASVLFIKHRFADDLL